MQPAGILLLAISMPNFVLGTLILLRNVKNRTNVFFAAFAGFVGCWSFGLAGYLLSDDKQLALLWARAYYIAAAMIAVVFLCFSLGYTGRWGRLTNRKKIQISAAPLLLIGAIIFFPQTLLSGLEYRSWGKEVILNRAGYVFYVIYFVSYVMSGFGVIFSDLRKSRGLNRLYLRYIFWGLIIAFSLGATFNLFYPAFGNYRYIWVGPLFTLAYVVLISYAIVKHKLFDVRLIVARSLGYLLSVLALSLLYGLVSFNLLSLVALSGDKISTQQQIMYTLLAVSFAFTFQPLKRFFDKATNKVFYRDAYDSRELMDNLNKTLVGHTNLESLLTDSANLIGTTLKAEFCIFEIREIGDNPKRIFGEIHPKIPREDMQIMRDWSLTTGKKVNVTDELGDDENKIQKILQSVNISVLARLTDMPSEKLEGMGYLILGNKKSGNQYNHDDIKILDILTDELIIAIQNALRFEEIEKFNATLQEKIDDATKQLQKTNDKLQALDETKDEFISMASHQLRTPLTSVKGYLSMVLEGDTGEITEMQRKLLDQAFTSSQRMVYLIADLLNVSRLRTGKFLIEPIVTNLADVVESEVHQLAETAKGRGLTLSYDKPADFPNLMLDETKIRQVMMNFMDNAIYYAKPNGHVTVGLKETDKTIEFTVSDDGIGVPNSEQHHLFTKFYRAGNAKKARPDGTGLGLFMAKKVIMAQGGAIIFKSEENKGSTFGFTFDKSKLQPPVSSTQTSS